MVTLDEARAAKAKVIGLALTPSWGGGSAMIGLTKGEGGGFGVRVSFRGAKPACDLPDEIDGVPVLYEYGVGEIRALGSEST